MIKRPGASLPGLPRSSKLSTSDAIIANALALAEQLGVSEREIARSCLTAAITMAERQGDPDAWISILTGQIKEQKQ